MTLTISDGALTAATTREGEDLAATLDPWDLERALGID